jgi:hypothetical protein
LIPRWAAGPDRTVDIPKICELLRQGISPALALRTRFGSTARSRSTCSSSRDLDFDIYIEIRMEDYSIYPVAEALSILSA